jgi:hypothetical protein
MKEIVVGLCEFGAELGSSPPEHGRLCWFKLEQSLFSLSLSLSFSLSLCAARLRLSISRTVCYVVVVVLEGMQEFAETGIEPTT